MSNLIRMRQRLDYLSKLPEIGVRELNIAGLVSCYYDYRCLSVDRWYLSTRKQKRPIFSDEDTTSLEDPTARLLYRTIMAALFDLKSGRICDANAWIGDLAPYSIDTCKPDCHVCASSARAYLLNVSHIMEEYVGLSNGTLKDLVKRQDKKCDV